MTHAPEQLEALVIGAGPAGLMAAETLAEAGIKAVVTEAKPTAGRKFLMAGKSGLNLTKDLPEAEFLQAYGGDAAWLAPMLHEFGPQAVCDWARSLGQPVFTGSTGRVFPVAMKASPLLRAWLRRLERSGVSLRQNWRWQGWRDEHCVFDTPKGRAELRAGVTVLACGGASWPRLGSDGAWAAWVAEDGHGVAEFQSSNAAIRVPWSHHMAAHFGHPLKAVAFNAGDRVSRGEAIVAPEGLEGSGVYALSPAIRRGVALRLDLCPDLDVGTMADRLAAQPPKTSVKNRLRKALGFDAVKSALAQELGRPLSSDAQALARSLKALPVPYAGLASLDRAISSVGGLTRDAVDDHLMLRDRSGTFAAGEMLNWDAPTGGFLITACLATGRWAGRHAARHLRQAETAR